MNERRAFENSPDVVADARRFVTERLGEVSPEIARIVGLMVSELATNCVRHTTSGFTVEIERIAREICVRVSDRAEGIPVIRSPAATDPSGRGLQLVDELADSFGVDYDAARLAGNESGTKTVWFSSGSTRPNKPRKPAPPPAGRRRAKSRPARSPRVGYAERGGGRQSLRGSLAKNANEQKNQEDDENGSNTDVHAIPFSRPIRPAGLFPGRFARKPAIVGVAIRVHLLHMTQKGV